MSGNEWICIYKGEVFIVEKHGKWLYECIWVFGEVMVLLFKDFFSNSSLVCILDLWSKFTFMYTMCTLASYSILRILLHNILYHSLDTFKMSHLVIVSITFFCDISELKLGGATTRILDYVLQILGIY